MAPSRAARAAPAGDREHLPGASAGYLADQVRPVRPVVIGDHARPAAVRSWVPGAIFLRAIQSAASIRSGGLCLAEPASTDQQAWSSAWANSCGLVTHTA